MRGLFVSGTTTGAGKTTIAVALVRTLRARGRSVAAFKPIETGVDRDPEDAIALAAACGRPELAHDAAWHRGRLPLSPRAACLEGEPEPDLARITARIAAIEAELRIVEGAGGLLVPIDRQRTIADLAAALALPLLIVAPDRLGALSDVLAVCEAADRRSLRVAAVALSRVSPDLDRSTRTNAAVLRERLPAPIGVVEHGASDVAPLLDSITFDI